MRTARGATFGSGHPGGVLVFAHRGGAVGRRENTLGAFEAALEAGAGGLESDVWLTADGVAVLDHDGMVGPLERPDRHGPFGRPGRRRKVGQLARRELPGRVPGLADLYAACGSAYQLSLDLCDPAALPEVVRLATAAGGLGRLWLCHGDHRRLAAWRDQVGEARLVHSTKLAGRSGNAGGHAAALARAGVDAVNLPWRQWRPERVDAFHGEGLATLAWGVARAGPARRLAEMGIDGLYGNRVAVLSASVARASGR